MTYVTLSRIFVPLSRHFVLENVFSIHEPGNHAARLDSRFSRKENQTMSNNDAAASRIIATFIHKGYQCLRLTKTFCSDLNASDEAEYLTRDESGAIHVGGDGEIIGVCFPLE